MCHRLTFLVLGVGGKLALPWAWNRSVSKDHQHLRSTDTAMSTRDGFPKISEEYLTEGWYMIGPSTSGPTTKSPAAGFSDGRPYLCRRFCAFDIFRLK